MKIKLIFLFYKDPDLVKFTGGGLAFYTMIKKFSFEKIFDVKIVSTHYFENATVKVRIYRKLPHKLNFVIWVLLSIIRIMAMIKENGIIVIIGGDPSSPVTLLPLYIIKKIFRNRVCTISFCQLPVKGIKQRIYAAFLWRLDAVIPSTSIVLTSLRSVNVHRVTIPTGYGVLRCKVNKQNMKKDIDCLFLGRFTKEKGGYDFVKIAELVNIKRPSTKFVVVGEADERIVKLAKKVRLPIEFVGFVEHSKKWDYLARSKIMVYPSRYDSFAISVAEAMSVGLPVVTWNISPFREEFGDSQGVILVKPFDHKEFAEKTVEVLENPDKQREQGLMNRNFAHRFQWEEVYERFKYAVLSTLRECLLRSKGG